MIEALVAFVVVALYLSGLYLVQRGVGLQAETEADQMLDWWKDGEEPAVLRTRQWRDACRDNCCHPLLPEAWKDGHA